jgi:4-hydroxybenzoyl-CoA thioesterase
MTAFRARLKVHFGDIDQAGIVYYPRFLHKFHVALEDFFSDELGIDYPTLVLRHRIGLPTVHLETDFKKSLRYGDAFEVEIRVVSMGNSSITFGYTVYLEDQQEVATTGQNITVCLDMITFQKRAIPNWLREKLENYQKKCEAADKETS